MTNIQTIFKNPVLEEVFEYLETNNYERRKQLVGSLFVRDDKAVIIYADRVSFRRRNTENDLPEYVEYQSFEGISLLSSTDWIYLFHITGLINIGSVIRNVRKELGSKFSTDKIASAIFGSIKTTLFIGLLLLSVFANAQPSFTMRTGYSFKTVDAFVAPGINFKFADAVTVGTEMQVNTRDDAPVNLGAKLSYQHGPVEVGVGGYYQLYTLDAYDKSRNGFAPSAFAAAHWRVFFVQGGYLKQWELSIGIRANL